MTGPLLVVKKTEDDLLDLLGTELGFVSCICRWNEAQIELDPWQVSLLLDRSAFRCLTKTRQGGGSFMFSAEALARSHLRDGHTAVFVSYNLDDAKEKILYVDQLHEELPLAWKKRRITNSKTEISFGSNKSGGRLSRILSHPSRAPRGKHGDIYLDELAHYADDRTVYKGSTALIVRVQDAQVTIGSTPLGRRGLHWEIAMEEVRRYPSYSRQFVPWWLCHFLCSDVQQASVCAERMATEDRVQQFGTGKVKEQFGSMDLEDFQQEFECRFVDESMSFFPYELILPCTDPELQPEHDFDRLLPVRGRLTAGIDVGRRHDLTELVVMEEINQRMVMRLVRRWERQPFEVVQASCMQLLDTLPLASVWIDETGIGMQLAETLAKHSPLVVRPVSFTNAKKEIWATDLKILMQQRNLLLPRDRELVAQIHSIRKSFTQHGSVKFDAEYDSRMKGHADRFWALALACQKERGGAETWERGDGTVDVSVVSLDD